MSLYLDRVNASSAVSSHHGVLSGSAHLLRAMPAYSRGPALCSRQGKRVDEERTANCTSRSPLTYQDVPASHCLRIVRNSHVRPGAVSLSTRVHSALRWRRHIRPSNRTGQMRRLWIQRANCNRTPALRLCKPRSRPGRTRSKIQTQHTTHTIVTPGSLASAGTPFPGPW